MKKSTVLCFTLRRNIVNIACAIFLITDLIWRIAKPEAVPEQPFNEEGVYATFVLCIIFGVFSWRDMQILDARGSVVSVIFCALILPLILLFAYHNIWVNILGFYLFVGSGFIAAVGAKAET